MWRLDPLQIFLAIGLDLLLGDPRGWPHVVKLAGMLAVAYERLFTRFAGRTVFSGAVFWLAVAGTILLLYVGCHAILAAIHPRLGWIFDIAVVYQTLAATDLHRHVRAVF